MFDTIVLPGGGVKGFCLLGAIQACNDNFLLHGVKTFVGTSVGSIISYLIAIGYTPVEIMVSIYSNKWFDKMQYFNLVAMINGEGATTFSNIQEALEKLTINKIGKYVTLGKLKEEFGKTLICTTYNMTKCMVEYLGPDNYPDLPCLTAIRMSCNIPLVFDRFKYMDCFYIDGGLSDNFPIKKGDEIGEKILGLSLELNEQSLQDRPDDGVISYIIKLLQIPIIQSSKYKISLVSEKCTIIPIKSGNIRNLIEFNVKSKTRFEMFSDGYSSIKEYLEKNSLTTIQPENKV